MLFVTTTLKRENECFTVFYGANLDCLHPEDGSSVFLRCIGNHLQSNALSKSKRPQLQFDLICKDDRKPFSSELIKLMSMLVFRVETPGGLTCASDTNVLKEHTASSFSNLTLKIMQNVSPKYYQTP